MKTGLLTLLMIGIAMTGCGQSKPKIAIPAGQFDAATFKGPWPTKKVDCIDLGNNYFNVHYQDGAEMHFADSRPNRDVPPIPDPMPPDVDNADLCSELHADKPAKPSAKKAEPKPFKCDPTKLQSCASQANDDYGPGRRGLVGEIDWSAPASKYLKAAPPPLDVPALRKPDEWGNCSTESGVSFRNGHYECLIPSHWDCEDRDAYSLQVSVSGKNANCHRIVP